MILPTFQTAIENIPENMQKHLLLGNGFSQAWRADVFSYGSLLDKANFSLVDPVVRECFRALGTTDFEVVIKLLKDSATILSVYNGDVVLAEKMKSHSDSLKNLLVMAITGNHPDSPSQITEQQYRASRFYLRQFKNVYTLNYDLLLYWSLLHELDDETEDQKIKFDDGFRHPDGETESAYVSWEMENTNNQNIYYLHGALHLYESRPELIKFTWNRTGLSLLAQIRGSLAEDKYPLIVAEGTSEQKMSRIMQSSYLQRGLKSLASIGGALVIYGFSFSENDAHILKRITKSKIKRLLVGIYGDPNTEGNKIIVRRSMDLQSERSGSNKLEIGFFEASSAQVWG